MISFPLAMVLKQFKFGGCKLTQLFQIFEFF
jgi:hypothetical protein